MRRVAEEVAEHRPRARLGVILASMLRCGKRVRQPAGDHEAAWRYLLGAWFATGHSLIPAVALARASSQARCRLMPRFTGRLGEGRSLLSACAAPKLEPRKSASPSPPPAPDRHGTIYLTISALRPQVSACAASLRACSRNATAASDEIEISAFCLRLISTRSRLRLIFHEAWRLIIDAAAPGLAQPAPPFAYAPLLYQLPVSYHADICFLVLRQGFLLMVD